ncbi:hypothetical protein ACLBKU_06415 [Erythrobacter sp. NE805]|uniref:hypothetical protein n=1 Tax=Erythrobacter sp. NE805 TaxID=3389875 RepID=UPI00396B343E
MNVTETDLAIASALYPVMVECARQSPPTKLTYGQLLDEAQKRFPENEAVLRAIPISLGRRLDVVRMFLNEHALPDLTSLVVNADTGEVGSAFGADPIHVREQVAAFDWSTVSEEFDLHIDGLRKEAAARSRPKRNRDDAKKLMSAHYQQHRAALPKGIEAHRELIIELLVDGWSVEDAFEAAASEVRKEAST